MTERIRSIRKIHAPVARLIKDLTDGKLNDRLSISAKDLMEEREDLKTYVNMLHNPANFPKYWSRIRGDHSK